jgi:hypothetical protein
MADDDDDEEILSDDAFNSEDEELYGDSFTGGGGGGGVSYAPSRSPLQQLQCRLAGPVYAPCPQRSRIHAGRTLQE